MSVPAGRLVSPGEMLGIASLLAGAAVAVFLGVFAALHTPGTAPTLGFDDPFAMKVWLGSGAGVLAFVQLTTAVVMYRRGGRVIALVHRTSGVTAVLLSLPVAYSCIWTLGFGAQNPRVLLHSLAGCLVYGALVTKLLSLHVPRMPSWLVTVAGSVLLTSVVAATLSSSLWYFLTFGTP